MGTLCLGILAGLITAYKLYTTGFGVYAKTDILVWTLPLAAYIFFSLTSAGLAFVSSIPVVFGIKRYEAIEKRTVFLEICVLLAAFVCLILHLGSPLAVFYLLLSPNPASPLWWLAMLYGVYLLILLASFWKIHNGQLNKALGILVFILAVSTSTTLGWLVGMADARPTLNPNFLTAFFPISAFACGLAAITLFSLATARFSGTKISQDRMELFDEIAKVLGITIGVTMVLFIWRMITGGVSSSALEFIAFKQILRSFSFHVEFWLGMVVPFVLMLIPGVRKTTSGKVLAGVLFLAGMLFGRLEIVLSGELMPLGAMAEGRPPVVSYVPTIWEVFVALFGLSVMLLVYTLGERHLKLEAQAE